MAPDFSQKTIDTLGKRARYLCSNPDCLVSTVGPNIDPEKTTIIGEAAHIFGARPGSKRYVSDMTDAARAEITNAIWLCRNCHKTIDSDPERFSAEILFAWREHHEEYVLSKLGNNTEHLQLKIRQEESSIFEGYPPIIKRIVIDKPDGWEWRLTSELLRYFNQPLIQKIQDLRAGFYFKPSEHIDEEYIVDWLNMRMKEGANLVDPISGLMNKLTESWGRPGESGNLKQIHHSCCLIREFLEQVVLYEERLYFAIVPEQYQKVISLLKGLLGSQAEKLAEVPTKLDSFVSLIDEGHEGIEEEPLVVSHTVEFDTPKGWSRQYERALKQAINHDRDQSVRNIVFILLLVLFVIYVL